MIQPISNVSMHKTAFKGFYDPANISIPASMREHLNPPEDTVDKIKNAVQRVLETKDSRNIINAEGNEMTHILPSGDSFTTSISPAPAAVEVKTGAGIQPIDGTNFVNGSGEPYHIMPDGTPYPFGGETHAAEAVDNIAGAGIQPIDGTNFIDGGGNLNHILQSGNSYPIDNIPAVDSFSGGIGIPDPTGSDGSVVGDIIGKFVDIVS